MPFVIVSRSCPVVAPDGTTILYPAGWTGHASDAAAATLLKFGAAVVDADRSAAPVAAPQATESRARRARSPRV